ncbi:hypothetical protein [Cupriavidus sp. CP313]
MQALCNYSLVADELTADRVSELHSLAEHAIDDWLSGKGAKSPKEEKGSFVSRTPEGGGTFTRVALKSDTASLLEVHLEELAKGEYIFTTAVSLVKSDAKVLVYISQMVQNLSVHIAPIDTDARCPKIVRSLLALAPEWKLGGESVPSSAPISFMSEEDGQELAARITTSTRTFPIVVVSENEGEPVWQDIAESLAYDLAGLAHVVKVSEAASWSLTDGIGKISSCYMGAIRLYWPNANQANEEITIRSRLWTASTLLSNDHDGKGALRFRSTIRRLIMSVAAVSVETPQEVKLVHSYVARSHLRELEEKATANSEELRVAKLFYEENEVLRTQVEELQKEVRNWSSRAQAAEYSLVQQSNALAADSVEDDAGQSGDVDLPPESGETRFYKKTHSTPSHDVFVRVTDCNHSSWQDASKAEKAKKGLVRLLGGDTWKSLHHCGKCTGGGVWRVRW